MLLASMVGFYAVLGLLVLVPEGVYSGDIGVKFVQAKALVSHRFTSLDIPYPGQFLDPARDLFPIRPPFVISSSGGTQAIFSPASAVLSGLAVSVAGLRGLILLSIVAAGAVLFAAWRLAPPGQGVPILAALGLGGPLWFYAVSGWEHAPAVAFGTAGFACAVLAPGRAAWLLGGLLVGAGSTLRDEVVLLLPGVLLIVWLRMRSIRPVLLGAAAAVVPLVAAAAVDVWWFGRPAAVHVRHAVHLLQIGSDATDPDVPVLEVLTIRQRYETVVLYWLLGYGNNLIIGLFVITLAVALLVRWKWQSSVGVLVWIIAVGALAAMDVHELLTAPKWVSGLHRLAPYLVFAMLPAPAGSDRRGFLPSAVVCTVVAYLLIAFAGVDTHGGKSLGPRLLLPLLPLLTIAAVARISNYVRAAGPSDRWIGRTGVLLAGMAIVMHLGGTIPAYRARNRDDASAVLAVAARPERVVMFDDQFTAQLLFPLYYRKILLLVDTPELGRTAGELLARERVSSAILVSRRGSAAISLLPYDLDRMEPAGRMMIQHWRR